MTTDTTAIALSRWSVVLETQDAEALAAFYVRLLGWSYRTQDEGWVIVGPGPDGPDLSFNTSADYRRPAWPALDGEQQMMLHLDFCVGTSADDLSRAIDRARAAGAVDADFQPQDDVRVMLDPAGHPFCLYVD